MKSPNPVCEVAARSCAGLLYRAVLVQYPDEGSQRGAPGRGVEMACLSLRISGYPEGKQSRYDPDVFYVEGLGDLTLQQ